MQEQLSCQSNNSIIDDRLSNDFFLRSRDIEISINWKVVLLPRNTVFFVGGIVGQERFDVHSRILFA